FWAAVISWFLVVGSRSGVSGGDGTASDGAPGIPVRPIRVCERSRRAVARSAAEGLLSLGPLPVQFAEVAVHVTVGRAAGDVDELLPVVLRGDPDLRRLVDFVDLGAVLLMLRNGGDIVVGERLQRVGQRGTLHGGDGSFGRGLAGLGDVPVDPRSGGGLLVGVDVDRVLVVGTQDGAELPVLLRGERHEPDVVRVFTGRLRRGAHLGDRP